MKPTIGISKENLKGVVKILSALLSDDVILYIKTRKFHWNVSGESFMELHLLFEGQYKVLESEIDEVAERINKLGSNTVGTTIEFCELASLKESPGIYPTSKDMIGKINFILPI